MTIEDQQAWAELCKKLGDRFNDGEPLSLEGVLFLIGVNELGAGYRNFSKTQKMELVHIAMCRLMSLESYYKEEGRDADGWPVWIQVQELPSLDVEAQEQWLRNLVLRFFEIPLTES